MKIRLFGIVFVMFGLTVTFAYNTASSLSPSTMLTNDVAYHIKCISCHEAATTRDPKLKAPQQCAECHKKS